MRKKQINMLSPVSILAQGIWLCSPRCSWRVLPSLTGLADDMSKTNSSHALVAALQALGVEPIPLQDMNTRDAFVRDVNIQTASVEDLLKTVEDHLAKTDVSREDCLDFELHRVIAIIEKLSVEKKLSLIHI